MLILFNLCFFSAITSFLFKTNLAEVYDFNNHIVQYGVIYFLVSFPVFTTQFIICEKFEGISTVKIYKNIDHKYEFFGFLKEFANFAVGCYLISVISLVLYTMGTIIMKIYRSGANDVSTLSQFLSLDLYRQYRENLYGFSIYIIIFLLIMWYLIWIVTRKERKSLIKNLLNLNIISFGIFLTAYFVLGMDRYKIDASDNFINVATTTRFESNFLVSVKIVIFSIFSISTLLMYFRTVKIEKKDIMKLSLFSSIIGTASFLFINYLGCKIMWIMSDDIEILNYNIELIMVYIPFILTKSSSIYKLVVIVIICYYYCILLSFFIHALFLFKSTMASFHQKFLVTKSSYSGKICRYGAVVTLAYSAVAGFSYVKNISTHYVFYYLVTINLIIELIIYRKINLEKEIFGGSETIKQLYRGITFFILPFLVSVFFIVSVITGMVSFNIEHNQKGIYEELIGILTLILLIVPSFYYSRKKWDKDYRIKQ